MCIVATLAISGLVSQTFFGGEDTMNVFFQFLSVFLNTKSYDLHFETCEITKRVLFRIRIVFLEPRTRIFVVRITKNKSVQPNRRETTDFTKMVIFSEIGRFSAVWVNIFIFVDLREQY